MVTAIVVAAGSSRRMGFDKMLAPLAGVPVVLRSLRAILAFDAVEALVLVGSQAVLESAEAWVAEGAVPDSVIRVRGGSTRQESVAQGLKAAPAPTQWVLVHDGARPLVAHGDLVAVLAAAKRHGAASLGHPVVETLRRVDDLGRILPDEIDRAGVWAMETPQAARRDRLAAALDRAARCGVPCTDETSVLTWAGEQVVVVPSTQANPKITRPGDLEDAERRLSAG